MGRSWRLVVAAVLLTGLTALSPVHPAQAAATVGAGTAGSCTEAALNAALAGGGFVTFDCGPNPVTIPLTGEKTINDDTQIDGGGLITLDGQNGIRTFRVNNGVTLELRGLRLVQGRADRGGAIRNNGGVVTIIESILSSNSATITGGAIDNRSPGTITIIESTLSDNTAGLGGAIYGFNPGTSVTVINSTFNNNSAQFGGAIFNDGGETLTVTNSTFSGNIASNNGGGIYNTSATATITNSTFSDNSAASGGAIHTQFGSATLILQNTILATSPSSNNCDVQSGAAITSQGGNLSDDDTCSLGQPSDFPDTEDSLGPLADNGGPTFTHVPQSASAAVDAALSGPCPATDQRGITRPQGEGCDIGAVELGRTATFPLCASYYTGAVTSPLRGACGSGTVEITPFDTSFCIDVYTGRLLYTFGRPCNPPRRSHTLPDDGDLLTCVSLYTGASRWVRSHGQCKSNELPNTIPATP